jgi:hypothetical protein
MAGVVGDVVQVTLTGTVLGELMENVHFYRVEDEPSAGYLEGLCTEFQSEVLPAYATVQHDEVLYTRITARNIFDFDEFVLQPLTPDQGSGTTSDPVPSFVAASIQLTRGNARVRNGRKSIAGAMEGQMISQVWDTGYLANLQLLADALAATLNPGLVDLFAPIIVGRVFVPADPPAIPRAYYRLPASQAEMDTHWAYVVSALASPDVSTQNLRKKGHGA